MKWASASKKQKTKNKKKKSNNNEVSQFCFSSVCSSAPMLSLSLSLSLFCLMRERSQARVWGKKQESEAGVEVSEKRKPSSQSGKRSTSRYFQMSMSQRTAWGFAAGNSKIALATSKKKLFFFFFFFFFFFSSSSRAGFLLCGFAVGVAAFKVDAMLKTHTLLNTTGCLDDVHENCPFVSAVIFFFVGPAMRCSWCHACTHPLRCLLVFGACVCRGAVPQTSTHSLPCLCACERKTAT